MYTGDDGCSHFEDLEIPQRKTKIGAISPWLEAAEVLFREAPPDLFLDWHLADRRVLIVMLSGAIEVTLGDETRRFGPGEMVLAEDLEGQGHQTREVEGPRRSIMIGLPDAFDVSAWRTLS